MVAFFLLKESSSDKSHHTIYRKFYKILKWNIPELHFGGIIRPVPQKIFCNYKEEAGPGAYAYTGCHKYVPLARFPNRRTCRVQRVEIITNMTTAMLLERLDQAILSVIDNPEKTQQTAAIGRLFWQTL